MNTGLNEKITIDIETAHAYILKQVLDVDSELKSNSKRTLTATDQQLIMYFIPLSSISHFECESIRVLRLCLSAFLDNLVVFFHVFKYKACCTDY